MAVNCLSSIDFIVACNMLSYNVLVSSMPKSHQSNKLQSDDIAWSSADGWSTKHIDQPSWKPY